MAYLQAKNNAFSTLSVAMLIADTTLTVASAASFPTTPFNLTIDNEIVQVTAISTNVFTVTRAQEGTIASAHESGVSVQLRITAEIIKEIQNAIATLLPYIGATEDVDLGSNNLNTTGRIGIGTTTPAYPIQVKTTQPWFSSTDSSTNIFASFTASGGNNGYPRSAFVIGSNLGNNINNVGFWVYPSVLAGTQKTAFIEAMTSPDTLSTSTKRLMLSQGTTLGQIKTSSQSGSSPGTDLEIYTQGVTNPQLYLKQSTGDVGVGNSAPKQRLDVNGGVRMNTATVRPTAEANSEGTLWVVKGATGVADTVQICLKSAGGTFSWITLATG